MRPSSKSQFGFNALSCRWDEFRSSVSASLQPLRRYGSLAVLLSVCSQPLGVAQERPKKFIQVDGKQRPVVHFNPSSAHQEAQLGTPLRAQVVEPARAPIPSLELAPPVANDSAVVYELDAENNSATPQPPSYSLLKEIAPPAQSRVTNIAPPNSLPQEAWQAASELTAAPQLDDLSIPESYKKLVRDEEALQLTQSLSPKISIDVQSLAPPQASVASLAKPLRWYKPLNQETTLSAELETQPATSVNANSPFLSVSNESLKLGSADTETVEPKREKLTSLDRVRKDDEKLVNEMLKSLGEKKHKVVATGTPNWVSDIRFPLLRYSHQRELALVDAIHAAVQYAPEIEILRTQVGINRAEIIRQQAGFDWNRFLEANWDERNVPVGSDLDGAFDRLENHTLASTFGLRRQNQYGGQLQLAQDLGLEDSNSQFFNPQNQATAQIALEYQQPLLQGAGLFVNRSVINIAIANAAVSQEELVAGLQEHVLEVVRAYWDLVARRGEFVIQKRSYERAFETAKIVANRQALDVGPVQSARAEATLGARRTALLQAEYAVVFAQERLLRLIFGQLFKESVDTEIVPTSNMVGPIRNMDIDLELQVGLKNRPEVARALQLIKRSSIEQGVAKNQLLPALGLSLSLSNQGLRGNRGLASAIDDQWNLGDPTYGIGLEYAFPVGNRAAKANLRQAQLRIRQFQKEFERVLSDVALEVRNAVHNVTLSGKQRKTTGNALALAKRELDVLERRAELLIDGDEVGPLYLDNILQAQERLATAELGYLNASSSYALAHFELQRANGGLLRCSPLPVEAAPTNNWSHRMAGYPMATSGQVAPARPPQSIIAAPPNGSTTTQPAPNVAPGNTQPPTQNPFLQQRQFQGPMQSNVPPNYQGNSQPNSTLGQPTPSIPQNRLLPEEVPAQPVPNNRFIQPPSGVRPPTNLRNNPFPLVPDRPAQVPQGVVPQQQPPLRGSPVIFNTPRALPIAQMPGQPTRQ